MSAKKELKEKLREKGLKVSGNKPELVKRLEKAQAVEEEPEEEPQFYGVNKLRIEKIKDLSDGKKKVYLVNGVCNILSEEELKVRLEEAK